MDSSEHLYHREVSKYPERFGALSGLFLVLIEELKLKQALDEQRIKYYETAFRGIDNHPALMYHGPQAKQCEQGKDSEEKGK